MPNTLAYLVLIIYPLIAWALMARHGMGHGTFIALVLAHLFLPAAFSINLIGIPSLDKFTVVSFVIIAFCLTKGKRLHLQKLPNMLKLLVLVFLCSPLLTALANSNPYLHLPGLTLYDGISDFVQNLLFILPFLVAVSFIRTADDLKRLLKVLGIAVLVYVPLVLYEIRMSPQLNTIVYGYFPHSFLQQIRYDGFRAVVFTGHGLLVAMFLAISFIAVLTLSKIKYRVVPQVSMGVIITLLVITLFLQKSLGSIFLVILAIAIFMFNSKTRLWISLSLCIIFVSYPIASSFGLFPHESIVKNVAYIDSGRASSLEFRFRHEKELLSRANEKPVTGWGRWGRSRVYDLETYEDMSVTDGRWIITLGSYGWLGFMTVFGLFVYATWLPISYRKQLEKSPKDDLVVVSGLAIIIAMILIDQLPNSSLNSMYLFLVGALTGRILQLKRESKLQINTNNISHTDIKSSRVTTNSKLSFQACGSKKDSFHE